MPAAARVRAWSPAVPGLVEVLHAHFPNHAYPLHAHDTWTVLLVDQGTVRYDLGPHERATARSRVTVLPPYVAHDGRSVDAAGFSKRVLYLDRDRLDAERVGRWVDRPELVDPALRAAIDGVHRVLTRPGDELAAEEGVVLVTERLRRHLERLEPSPDRDRAPSLARRLRELIDADVVAGITLSEAAVVLGAEPHRLVRAFRREIGVSPHRYLVGRRVDLARRGLLAGARPAEVAVASGFYDQAHLHRHFRRMLGVTPGQFAAASR